MASVPHIHDELAANTDRIVIDTKYGSVTGGRAKNGTATFLEIPYALPPGRFMDPEPLPPDYRYAKKEYITEDTWAFQPRRDGEAAAGSYHIDQVGYGKPSENPLFVNIFVPPLFPSQKGFPVKVYLHGGFLQYSSPHRMTYQNQFVAADRSEVWVNVGYRLSAFGFLACDKPKIIGNFGFKDQWIALEWVRENISVFGGNPDNVQLVGLSGGAHAVHQNLHHVSHLPEGAKSPFQSAHLMSNAMVLTPKTPTEMRPQFQAFCRALHLDPTSSTILDDLRAVPAETICRTIESKATGPNNSTFRGCLNDDWLPSTTDAMTWQRSGAFAQALKQKGVRSVIVGDLTDEWYFYSTSSVIEKPADIVPNLERYYQDDIAEKIMGQYETLGDGATPEECAKMFGRMTSDYQVHLPVRILARDLHDAGFPVLRYEIQWTPEQNRTSGYVTHGTDTYLWHLRLPSLEPSQAKIARAWIRRVDEERTILEREGKPSRANDEVFALCEDKSIKWVKDDKWTEKMRLLVTLPGEV
ncbi:Alpha/Beta hydrolase protein [Armillaria nabsnona]|nr:Alpha/Beta hydrolase protein [Armillaria nabsnona]